MCESVCLNSGGGGAGGADKCNVCINGLPALRLLD